MSAGTYVEHLEAIDAAERAGVLTPAEAEQARQVLREELES